MPISNIFVNGKCLRRPKKHAARSSSRPYCISYIPFPLILGIQTSRRYFQVPERYLGHGFLRLLEERHQNREMGTPVSDIFQVLFRHASKARAYPQTIFAFQIASANLFFCEKLFVVVSVYPSTRMIGVFLKQQLAPHRGENSFL